MFIFLLLLICFIYILTFLLLSCSDHAAEGGAVFADRAASPQAAHVEEPVKAAAQMSAQELVEELTVVAARQAELVTQLKAQSVVEGGTLAQKDEQIALLRAQLAGVQAEVLAATEHAKKATDEKVTALSELQHARGELHQFKANLTWG